MSSRNLGAYSALVVALCGCSSGGGSGIAPRILPAAAARSTGKIKPPFSDYLYVGMGPTSKGPGHVAVYAPGQTKPAETIRKGNLNYAVGIAFDGSGNVYILSGINDSEYSVVVYPPGSGKPLRTILGTGQAGNSIALDSSGNVYVSYQHGNAGGVQVYAAGTKNPLRNIQIAGNPEGIAFDSADNLYVSNNGLFGSSQRWSEALGRIHRDVDVEEFQAGTSTLLRRITNGVTYPKSLAFDTAGNLYVANGVGSGRKQKGGVSVYAPGSSVPLYQISNVNPCWNNYGQELAFDSSGNLYVGDTNATVIDVYHPLASEKSYSISVDDTPVSLAFSQSGDLFALVSAFGDEVDVISPGASSPSYTITDGVFGAWNIAISP